MNCLNRRNGRLAPLPAAIQNSLLSVTPQQLFLPRVRLKSQQFPRKPNHIPAVSLSSDGTRVRVILSQNWPSPTVHTPVNPNNVQPSLVSNPIHNKSGQINRAKDLSTWGGQSWLQAGPQAG
jgi:hypothetical protein